MWTRIGWTPAAVVGLLLVTHPAVARRWFMAPQVPGGDPPPPEVWAVSTEYHEVRILYTDPPSASVGIDTLPSLEKVSLGWSAMPEGLEGPPVYADNSFPVPFWPTHVTGSKAQHGRFYVAGKTERGRTRIVRYELGEPALGVTQTGGGEVSYTLVPGPVLSARELLDIKEPGKDTVGSLYENLADGERLFVHFHDSGDVYDLDGEGGELTLVASATDASAPFVIPEIGRVYNVFAAREHLVHGYYYLYRHFADLDQPQSAPFVMMDVDEDGEIDQVQTIGPGDWDGLQLEDTALLVND